MIITSIETFPLRIPFRPGNSSAVSAWGPKDQHAVDSLLVRVTTDQGLEGWGEAFGFTGVPVTQQAIDAVIAPLHRLLGGGRDDLACYASLEAYSEPDLVRAAREEAGPDVALMIGVNAAWTVKQAQAMARELRELGPKWLEEPVWPPENYDGLAQVRRAGGVATAALGTADSMIEWRFFDLEAQIPGDSLAVKDGRVPVPQGPGLGIDPDPDVIRAYRWDGRP
jgi:L-alanine-DL-glutamate epimerase-like enolase superfamily enzyme